MTFVVSSFLPVPKLLLSVLVHSTLWGYMHRYVSHNLLHKGTLTHVGSAEQDGPSLQQPWPRTPVQAERAEGVWAPEWTKTSFCSIRKLCLISISKPPCNLGTKSSCYQIRKPGQWGEATSRQLVTGSENGIQTVRSDRSQSHLSR